MVASFNNFNGKTWVGFRLNIYSKTLFEHFQYFHFETNFLENENLFQKTGVLFFSWNH